MSNANIAFVQSLYAAFGKGDIATIIAALTPDVDWTVNGRRKDYPHASAAGKGRLRCRNSSRLSPSTRSSSDFTPREFFAADDRVFVLGHYAWKIRKTGRTVGQRLGAHLHHPRRQGHASSANSPTPRNSPKPIAAEPSSRYGLSAGPALLRTEPAPAAAAFFQASMPPWMWQADGDAASCAACTAMAERSPKAQ